MKNVTISLDDDTAAWARVEAAKAGKSLSRYVGDLLARQRGTVGEDSWKILKGFIEGPGYPGISEDLPSRDELYGDREEELVRRHEHPDLHSRPEGTREARRRR